ncbi:MAG: thiamine phosphate synthase [Paramuribaculum sp.]|nr:thiamine phosphate synthase [Paramuribaculum sp.]
MGVREFPIDSFRLQFITHGDTVGSLISQTHMALDGGCRWVQLRAKHFSPEMIIAAGTEMSRMCHEVGAVMIIDDHTNLVTATGADGVHLGRNDMSVTEARDILGPKYIIGATANTAAHIEEAYQAGADYIGLGPFRFTTTKSNLSPVLGEEGYRAITRHCHDRDIHIPIVAIGGITPDDIAGIIAAGADGIAVSGTIISSENPVVTTRRLKQLIDLNIKHNTH